MSDTHIHYRWIGKNGEEDGMIVCDRGVFKGYLGMYANPEPLKGRFQNCDLVAIYDQCLPFLEDICNFWKSTECGYAWEYEEFGKDWYEDLKKEKVIEIKFCCY